MYATLMGLVLITFMSLHSVYYTIRGLSIHTLCYTLYYVVATTNWKTKQTSLDRSSNNNSPQSNEESRNIPAPLDLTTSLPPTDIPEVIMESPSPRR